jgi:hypothetical protein
MKLGQPFVDLPALAVTDKEFLSVQTKGKSGVSGSAPADQFRGVTKLIAYGKRWASDQFATQHVANPIVAVCKATTEKSSVVQTEGKSEVSDHFRGVTKMVVYGNVAAIRQFSTQCEENLNEVPA